MTAKMKVCNAGITAFMKVRYRFFQMERALYVDHTRVMDIYIINILTARKSLQTHGQQLLKIHIEQIEIVADTEAY